eukprot:CAMPEP_0171974702 /NCGR_PEP_ID=MMETSP0993-20121228/233737_1 /TAXON_ID=483369 /ORGANISM="non described non described, Strain CCMP2098" /LENGTH=305 /DNA_ID=CAMNT_0012625781 /DNA_START=97 /DNA_END=1011 /DNA_ORIENTATION=-
MEDSDEDIPTSVLDSNTGIINDKKLLLKIEHEVTLAKRSFERLEIAHKSAEMTQNRSNMRAMLASAHLAHMKRASHILPAPLSSSSVSTSGPSFAISSKASSSAAAIAHASPPELMTVFRSHREKLLAQQRHRQLQLAGGGGFSGGGGGGIGIFGDTEDSSSDSEQDDDDTGAINEHDLANFSFLWRKLVKCGWKCLKGHGLTSWMYLRPGASSSSSSSASTLLLAPLAAASPTAGSGKARRFAFAAAAETATPRKECGDTEAAAPHAFTYPAQVIKFVTTNRIDAVERTGHISEAPHAPTKEKV